MLRRSIAWLLCFMLLPLAAVAETPTAIQYLTPDDTTLPTLGAEGQLEVHCISVGAADAFLLRCDGQTMLIDCGEPSAGDTVLSYLESIGVEKLDYAMMTHLHNDHIGGYLRVLADMPVDTVILPQGMEDFHSKVYDELAGIIAEKRLPTLLPNDSAVIPLGGAALTLYQWQEPDAKMNDQSLLVLARYGKRTMLFTGDVENNGQRALAERLGSALSADILKMPHHGLAAYMQVFHEAVQPEIAVYTNAKHRIMEKNRKMMKRYGIHVEVTTIGTLLLVTNGELWTAWQLAKSK